MLRLVRRLPIEPVADTQIAKLHGYLVDRAEQTTNAVDDLSPAERAAELARVEAELDEIENPPATGHKGHTQH